MTRDPLILPLVLAVILLGIAVILLASGCNNLNRRISLLAEQILRLNSR